MKISFIKFISVVLIGANLASCSNDTKEDEPIIEPEVTDPAPEGKEMKYRVAQLSIDTKGAEIASKKEYIDCQIALDADGEEWDFSADDALIRGRGNSTWLWYHKKAYRIKLNKKAALMGMCEGKSWVLLANYRDPTDLMNTFVFELGSLCALPFTNHTRYVDVTLNGKEIGLYQLTEQVQQGKGRVNIDEKEGYLISLDKDDGPELAPSETDNFWSQVYKMPVCVKNPDEPTSEILSAVKTDLGQLELAIKNSNYDKIKSLLDISSFIDYVIIQELVYNVELEAPRSMYMHKDKDGDIWHMGPLWDFDAGYDFDWSTMYTGHKFFTAYNELVLGTKPATHGGTIYSVPGFFSDMFKIRDFVAEYKARWKEVREMVPSAWESSRNYVDEEIWSKEEKIWPIGYGSQSQIDRMENWINNRVNYLDSVINAY